MVLTVGSSTFGFSTVVLMTGSTGAIGAGGMISDLIGFILSYFEIFLKGSVGFV